MHLSVSQAPRHRPHVVCYFFLLLLGLQSPAHAVFVSVPTCRYGEARHPCPDMWLSTSNPSGLRGKNLDAIEFEPGVHCFSETQLSAVTLPQVSSQLRHLGRVQGRNLRIAAGAAAPLRAHSDDWPVQPVKIPWPSGIWETARVQIAQVLIEGLPLLCANVYGYSRSHPQATAATEALLEPITREIVFGRIGPRMICGDLNAEEDTLVQTRIWRQQGWIELQELAWQRWGTVPSPTCKDATRRDYLYLSPEVAAICVDSSVLSVFQEHSTLSAKLRIASNAGAIRYWPRPATIPWSSIALDGLQGQAHASLPQALDTTQRYKMHAQLFEQSLNGHVECPGRQLPSACYGRARFAEPAVKHLALNVPKASRAGDEVLQSDLLSLEVRRWFKQLRRLQSLWHALKQPRYDFAALEYRGNLWQSVLKATGFHNGFRAWWPQRPVQGPGSPAFIPDGVPTPTVAQAIFLDFRENFRRFESWHITQHGKILSARHDASKQRLYQELRQEGGKAADVLVNSRAYAILAVDSQERLVHVDQPLDFAGHSEWRIDGQAVQVSQISSEVCCVEGDVPLPADGELEQLQYVSSPQEVHAEFVQFWTQRWNKPCSDDQWTRILDFARAYLPQKPFVLSPISVTLWLSTLRRLKVRAARGPDGYARDDLLCMPRPRVEELLSLLCDIEGVAPWPAQLSVGLVHLLHKPGGNDTVSGYRPICVFSIVYRCWASIRARQILRWLKEFIPVGSLGFMPEHETTEAWYVLEGLIECALQHAQSLSGYGTDLVRAFNNLPRRPLFEAAKLLGLPEDVLCPWQSFVRDTQRRFVVQNAVSEPVFSSCGFAEGCPLSTVAMSVCSFMYHEYMQAFAPSVESLSYVDNLLGIGRGAFDVAVGMNATRCLCEALAMQLDDRKTYAWSTDASQRKVLRAMNLVVLDSCRELGGVVSFGPATRNRPLVQRCEQVKSLCAALKRSRASWSAKLSTLPVKFWSFALHGVSACPVSDTLLQSLRTQAVRALKAAPAGSSPALRLSLGKPMTADPGFFQCWNCLSTLRRLCLKQPRILELWSRFLLNFNGRLFHGPFSKLLVVLNSLGWQVRGPPMFVDEENLLHDLLATPLPALRTLAERAWLRSIAFSHAHRPSMRGLHGIDPCLVRLDHNSFSHTSSARVAALQCGALMFGEAQAKFDLTRSGLCTLCGVPDDKEHRVRFCPRFSSARQGHAAVLDRWDELPSCLKLHLLPPANAAACELRAMLHQTPDGSQSFLSCPSQGVQHLFTDGACTRPITPELATAAWGVVNATAGQIVATDHLPGWYQTAPRAELFGILASVCWVRFFSVEGVIWGDSLSATEGLHLMLEGHEPAAHWDNLDIWQRIWEQVAELLPGQLRVQHVTSHLDPSLCSDAFEEWVAYWNQRVDIVAGITNANRTWTFQDELNRGTRWAADTATCLRALRAVYLGIAESTTSEGMVQPFEPEHEAVDVELDHPAGQVRNETFSETLPLLWTEDFIRGMTSQPRDRARRIAEFIVSQDECSDLEYSVSWLELVAMIWGADPSIWFVSGRDHRVPVQAPTVAEQMRHVRRIGQQFIDHFGANHLRVYRLSGIPWGFGFPLDGIRIGASIDGLMRARNLLKDFASVRFCRSVADLERRF